MRRLLCTCWLCLYIHIFSKGEENNTRKVLGISQEHDVLRAFMFLNLVGELCMQGSSEEKAF